ncbi:response regulator [Candidatus Uabimicrobium sp. HlEnr_7]|uniref:response regulator n=1 Tax=Candidatus Uabimicrobium helgolandensis TaxID=3095367 RepID=UPI003555F333
MNFKLTFVDEVYTKSFSLEKGTTHVLGRSSRCDFQLDYDGISREHCNIWLDKNQVWIKDNGSSNGTKVNAKKISTKTILQVGDIVTIGIVELKLKVHNSQIMYLKEKNEPTFTLDSKKASKHLLVLHEVGKKILNSQNIVLLCKNVLESSLAMLNCDRGCIVLKPYGKQKTHQYIYCNYKDYAFDETEFSLSNFILETTIEKGIGTVSADAQTDAQFFGRSSIQNLELRSVLCSCIEGQNEIFGVIYLDSRNPGNFDGADLDLMTAVGRQLAFAIERFLLEQKLVTSQQNSIIEHSRDVIYRCNLNFHFTIVSPSIHNILGISKHHLLQSPEIWENSVYKDDKDAFKQMRSDVLQGKECTLKYRIRNPEQELIWVEESCYGIKNKDGSIASIQGVVKDITKNKLLEEKLNRAQKVEWLGVLAGGVAHDLNNILGGIVGYPDLILRKIPEDSPVRQYLIDMKNSGMLAARIVEDLLTMAREENYKMESLNLNQIVLDYFGSSTLKHLEKTHPEIEVKLELFIDELYILGSKTHISKIIMNLVSNAFHAMAEKGVLKVTTAQIDLDEITAKSNNMLSGKYIVLQVDDTGIGIAKENLDRIFEPFYSQKLNNGGTGLGLAIVYGIIRDHAGYIDVDSVVGKGTCFTVYFPLHKNVEKEVVVVDVDLQGTENILVVDDVKEQRELASNILTSLGHTVQTVSCGEEALECLSQHTFDIVLLDMIMENSIDGLETYQEILKIVPQQKVIIVSGFCKNDRFNEALKLGAKAYVKKPYTIDELGKTIREILKM